MLRGEKNNMVYCNCTGGEFEKHLQQDNRLEEDTIGSSEEERESV